jgi:enamine deaminase RidA (YjgF/YER057c/UK114 family)
MAKQRINPEKLSPPPGGIYSHVVRAGNTVYISGQLARDAGGNVIGLNEAGAQWLHCWSNVCAAVEAAGGRPADIVKIVSYVSGADNLPKVREAREKLAPADPPASTMIVVAGLADPRYLVEVDAIAVLED